MTSFLNSAVDAERGSSVIYVCEKWKSASVWRVCGWVAAGSAGLSFCMMMRKHHESNSQSILRSILGYSNAIKSSNGLG
jgi:hypothetical protein